MGEAASQRRCTSSRLGRSLAATRGNGSPTSARNCSSVLISVTWVLRTREESFVEALTGTSLGLPTDGQAGPDGESQAVGLVRLGAEPVVTAHPGPRGHVVPGG